MKAKGVHAVKLTWVKGHATQEDVDDGRSSHLNRLGNSVADQVADIATSLHGVDVVRIAGWMHQRYVSYVNFMKLVSQHIIEAYFIHRSLVNSSYQLERHALDLADRGTYYECLSYPEIAVTRKLSPCAGLCNFASFCEKHPRAVQVQEFLAGIFLAPTSGGQSRAITWIELYVLYRIRGFDKITNDPTRIAMARANPDKLLRDFKTLLRGVVSRVLAGGGDLALFRPGPVAKDVLRGLGILGPAANLSFNVHVGTDEKNAIAKALVRLSRHVTVQHLEDYIARRRKLVPKVLALNGKAGWDSTITTLSHAHTTGPDWDAAAPGTSAPQAGTQFYECKSCNKVEPSTCKEFQYHDLDLRRKCFHCKKHSEVKEWRCSCGVRWYLCPTHRKDSQVIPTSPHSHVQAKWQASSSDSRKRKAEVDTSDFEVLLEEDLRRERKRVAVTPARIITLGDVVLSSQGPTKLGPILSRRFGRP